MMYGIYLSANGDSEGFRLPVNPETLPVSASGDGETYKIAKLGSVNVPKDVDLKEFTIATFFPNQAYHFIEADFQKPQFYIDKIEKWQAEKKPIRFIYVNGAFTINEQVTIEDFIYSESYGTSDVDFQLDLLKYVPFGPKLLKIEKPKEPVKASPVKKKEPAKAPVKATVKKTPPRETKKAVPQTYSLVRGDSLWKVAQKYTGKGNNFGELAKLNGVKESDYRRLPIGLKLKIPPSWTKK